MDAHPPVPAIPAEHATLRQEIPARRHRSLPPTSEPKSRKRSPKKTNVAKPANPEVISSLISSLASVPFDRDSASLSVPSPSLSTHSDYKRTSQPAGWTVTHGNHDHPNVTYNEELYPDDAAEPPVVRTSRPPSGLSPLTAPKSNRSDTASSLKSYLRPGSRGSSFSIKDDGSSFRASTDGVIRRLSNASKESMESRKSGKGHRSLIYMTSRERLRVDKERKRATIATTGPTGASLTVENRGVSGQPSSPTSFVQSESIIEEEPSMPEALHRSSRKNKGKEPAMPQQLEQTSMSTDDGNSNHALPSVPLPVPDRASSLRHQNSPGHKKGHSRKSSRQNGTIKAPVIEEKEGVSSDERSRERTRSRKDGSPSRVKRKPLPAEHTGLSAKSQAPSDQGGPQVGATGMLANSMLEDEIEDKTTKRIKELQAQKDERARLSSLEPNTPTPSAQKYLAVELPKRSLSQSSHSESELSEEKVAHETPEKAHKVLGIIPTSTRRSTARAESPTYPHARETEGPVRGIGLAIDIPTAPAVSNDTSTRDSLDPRNSLGSQNRKVSSESYPLPSVESLSPKLPRSNSKKKRWSHPDLPSSVDMSSRKRESGHQSPAPLHPDTVFEERRASVDSVDQDVHDFMQAPRLSQKVRHSQTGRVISFSEVGDPNGFAVFCCVGMGLTRFITAFYDELAVTLKLRLITPERPGIGESERYAEGTGTPLGWPDDVLAICQALRITKFSIMAHSAGAIYALATALVMHNHIRGRVHLLAPWIPPSQMSAIGMPNKENPPTGALPRSQRFLRVLPTPFLKAANSSFLSATSASITRSVPKSPRNKPKPSSGRETAQSFYSANTSAARNNAGTPMNMRRESMLLMDQVLPNGSGLIAAASNPDDPNHEAAVMAAAALSRAEKERREDYESRLTTAIWEAATTNANPAVDLLICLERNQPIGFRYVDIPRAVVIHHGNKDTRVPLDNIKWLGRTMKRCEVRILEGEGHGLMASAKVMANVLTEMAKEWEDWTAAALGKSTERRPS